MHCWLCQKKTNAGVTVLARALKKTPEAFLSCSKRYCLRAGLKLGGWVAQMRAGLQVNGEVSALLIDCARCSELSSTRHW